MESLYQVREITMAFAKRYGGVISFVLRFFSGMVIYSAIMNIGHYNPAFATMANLGILFTGFMGLLFAILPLNSSYVIMILVTTVQFSAQLEIALIVLLGLVCMFLFYGNFSKREHVLVIAMLMGFYFNIPYIVPIIAGLYFGITSIIPMSIAALIVSYSRMIFSILTYDENGATVGLSLEMITDMELEDVFGAFIQLYESFSLDSVPVQSWVFLTIAIFVVFIFVYIVSRLPINYGKEMAIGFGTILNIIAFMVVNAVVNLGTNIGMIILMSLLSALIMCVYNFMNIALDYSRAGRVEFSDEDFHYYVKYIPRVKTTSQRLEQTQQRGPKQQTSPAPNSNLGLSSEDDDTHTYRPRTREDYRKETAAAKETVRADEAFPGRARPETRRVSPRTMERAPVPPVRESKTRK